MFTFLTTWITAHIETFGYSAILVLMGLESANIPIPSEIILPYGGFLVSQGKLNFHLVAFFGALGCLLGSLISYWLGKKFGRPFLEKYGTWFFIGPKQIASGDQWIMRYGSVGTFITRLLPVVRTFISFIAGIWKVPLLPFIFFSFIGSWIWSYFLAYLGVILGNHWQRLHQIWEKMDIAIVLIILCTLAFGIWHHWKNSRNNHQQKKISK